MFACTMYYFIIFAKFTCITYCFTGRTPLLDEELVSHEESRSGDFDFDQHGSQVSVEASQLHDAPRPSPPTQDPLRLLASVEYLGHLSL